ncbi:MAG TPA: hypothetical protein VKR22_13245, partial [Acidimicrobiales bacterium]|nr:hypothetical protein [Acidimicrobiales bacterium]
MTSLFSSGPLLAATTSVHIPKIAYLSILPVLVMLGGAVATLAVSSLQRRRMAPTAATAMAVMTTLAAL